VIIAGWFMMALGLVCYLGAFAKGSGPTRGDSTLQASLFTGATILMVLGFVFVAVI
jgi:hypothetical protein